MGDGSVMVVAEDTSVELEGATAIAAWFVARGRVLRCHGAWCIETTTSPSYRVLRAYTSEAALLTALTARDWLLTREQHYASACRRLEVPPALAVPYAVAAWVAELARTQRFDTESAVWDTAPEPARRVWQHLLGTYMLDFMLACDGSPPGITATLAAVAVATQQYADDTDAHVLVANYALFLQQQRQRAVTFRWSPPALSSSAKTDPLWDGEEDGPLVAMPVPNVAKPPSMANHANGNRGNVGHTGTTRVPARRREEDDEAPARKSSKSSSGTTSGTTRVPSHRREEGDAEPARKLSKSLNGTMRVPSHRREEDDEAPARKSSKSSSGTTRVPSSTSRTSADTTRVPSSSASSSSKAVRAPSSSASGTTRVPSTTSRAPSTTSRAPSTTSRAPPTTSRAPSSARVHEEDDEEDDIAVSGDEEEDEEVENEDDRMFVASEDEEVEEDTNIKRKVAMDDDEFVEYYEKKWNALNSKVDSGRMTKGQYALEAKVLQLQEREEHKRREAVLRRKAKSTRA